MGQSESWREQFKTIALGCIYRSPSSDSDNNQNLKELLRCVTDTGVCDIIIVGDFNYPNIDWNSHIATDSEHSESDQFIECTRNCFLIQHVDKPTRYRGDQRPSQLDLVLTTEESVIKNLSYLAPLGNSDHCILTFDYTCKTEILKSKTRKYKYDKGDYSGVSEVLTNVD